MPRKFRDFLNASHSSYLKSTLRKLRKENKKLSSSNVRNYSYSLPTVQVKSESQSQRDPGAAKEEHENPVRPVHPEQQPSHPQNLPIYLMIVFAFYNPDEPSVQGLHTGPLPLERN